MRVFESRGKGLYGDIMGGMVCVYIYIYICMMMSIQQQVFFHMG